MKRTAGRLIGLSASMVAMALSLASGASAAAPLSDCEIATRWAEGVIADMDLPLPDGWTLNLECGTDGPHGLASATEAAVTLWPQHMDHPAYVQWTYAHEAGHAYDYAALGLDGRTSWLAMRGLPHETPWQDYVYGGTLPDEDEWAATPSEDFADAFAYCVLGFGWAWQSQVGTPPSESLCRELHRLVDVP